MTWLIKPAPVAKTEKIDDSATKAPSKLMDWQLQSWLFNEGEDSCATNSVINWKRTWNHITHIICWKYVLNLNTSRCADISKLFLKLLWSRLIWAQFTPGPVHFGLIVVLQLPGGFNGVCVCVCVSATSWRCQATKRVDIKPKVIFQANIAWFRAWPIDAYTQQVKLTCLKTPQKNTSFWLSLPILHGWVCKSKHHIHVQIHRDVKCQINKCHLYTNLKTHATF